MPKVEWPLHIYRSYLENMASHLRSDQLLGHKYMEGLSAGYKGALEAFDMHVEPCSCTVCINKRIGEIDHNLSTDQITVFKPEVGRMSCVEPNVILDSTDTEAIESLSELDMIADADQKEEEKKDKEEVFGDPEADVDSNDLWDKDWGKLP